MSRGQVQHNADHKRLDVLNSVVYFEYKPAVTEGLTWNVSTWVTVTHYLFVLPFSFFAQVTRFLDVNSFSLWFLNSPANINPHSAQWDRSPLLKKSILRAALLLSFFFFLRVLLFISSLSVVSLHSHFPNHLHSIYLELPCGPSLFLSPSLLTTLFLHCLLPFSDCNFSFIFQSESMRLIIH